MTPKYPRTIYLNTTTDGFFVSVTINEPPVGVTPLVISRPITWAPFFTLDGDPANNGGAVLTEYRDADRVTLWPAACKNYGVDELMMEAVKLYPWPKTPTEAVALVDEMIAEGWPPLEARTFIQEWDLQIKDLPLWGEVPQDIESALARIRSLQYDGEEPARIAIEARLWGIPGLVGLLPGVGL